MRIRKHTVLGRCPKWIVACGLVWATASLSALWADEARQYTPLKLIPAPQVIASAAAFSESYRVENIVEPYRPGAHRADYASKGLAARTFIDFDFGHPITVAAFRHIQRVTPDTIAEADLIFCDSADFNQPIETVKILHVDEPGATTFAAFAPVTARFARWQVTSVLPGRSPNVGGQCIEFFTAEAVESRPSQLEVSTRIVPIVERRDEKLWQPLRVNINSPYAESLRAVVQIDGQEPHPLDITFGTQTASCMITATRTEQSLRLRIDIDGQEVVTDTAIVPAVQPLTVYILPHSHTDIGYTAIQTDIEEKQINNLRQGLADARRTAHYPEGARFIWNVEVLWAADLFLDRLPRKDRDEFFDAVRRGQVALNGMYLNELTGLCRPEELVRLFRYATQLGERTGVPIDSAMISDVPGYTWGTVTAMAQAGIRYFSVAPNYFDRIGTILVDWENKPFWWIGPDGQSKVLVWIPFWGYAMSHRYGKLSQQLVEDFCEGIAQRDYPYDIACVRWAGHGDNAVPDPIICDFVKEWNAAHVSPRFIISSTSAAFRAFEERYGDSLPEVRGDWTPYWEDGAGSSAAETALNRASSERLTQAETLWALLAPRRYPVAKFEAAWKDVLLYSEHTWGAHCSISQPENPFTIDQWNIKQSYATAANLRSRQLLSEAVQSGADFETPPADEAAVPEAHVDIYNTSSWPRTEVIVLPHELSAAGNFVTDDQGEPVPAQRLASHELAVLVSDLPPLAGRRYRIQREGSHPTLPALKVDATTLSNDYLDIRLHELTGAVAELRAAGLASNLVDAGSGHAINDYLYLIGDDVADVQRNGPVRISIRDRGPLVASLLVESDAPGCHKLIREVRLAAGSDHVLLINTVDKERLEAASYHASEGKESVNFAFPFYVPDGEVRVDLPLGVMRVEKDQMPSACKNWLTAGRWADVANGDYGVTWVTLDAPLVQVGGLTATLLNSQTNPDVWRKQIDPTQKLYSWAMNNHWGTNYRAYQEGPVVFRYALRPHLGLMSDGEASRFAISLSQPLVAVPGHGSPPPASTLLRVEPADVLVTALKPSDDGHAWIVRLLNTGLADTSVQLSWSDSAPRRLWLSDTSESPRQEIGGDILVPASGLITIRAELP